MQDGHNGVCHIEGVSLLLIGSSSYFSKFNCKNIFCFKMIDRIILDANELPRATLNIDLLKKFYNSCLNLQNIRVW